MQNTKENNGFWHRFMCKIDSYSDSPVENLCIRGFAIEELAIRALAIAIPPIGIISPIGISRIGNRSLPINREPSYYSLLPMPL